MIVGENAGGGPRVAMDGAVSLDRCCELGCRRVAGMADAVVVPGCNLCQPVRMTRHHQPDSHSFWAVVAFAYTAAAGLTLTAPRSVADE
jgi:hypothetical protein